MFCQNCRSNEPDAARFCGACGTDMVGTGSGALSPQGGIEEVYADERKMSEFIIPGDGLVVKTEQGLPVLELSTHSEGNVLRMFGSDGQPKIAFGIHEDSGVIIVGNPEANGIVITVDEDISEIGIANSGTSISMAIDQTGSEFRFVNVDGANTAKIYVDENGGQFGMADHKGRIVMSAGATEQGGLIHLMDSKGGTVVSLESNEDNGNITLLDEDGNIRLMIRHKEDGNIHLIDKAGHIVWTTLQQ